jgi:putative DNA primase/helicase
MNILLNNGPGRNGAAGVSTPSIETSAGGKLLPAAWARPLPGEEVTSPDHVYEASRRLVEAGLSVIPIEAYEGSKSPYSFRLPRPHDHVTGKPRPSWSVFKIRRPNADELRRWRETDGPYGLAVIGGSVSGGEYGFGLEVIDIDTADLAGPWIEAVERQAPGLVSRLVRVRTPRPGMHVYYRCRHFGVSQKLAFAAAKDDFDQPALDAQGNPVRKTLIEMKAEGGYCLVPPSPPRVHPSGRLYQYAEGSADLTFVPTITAEERGVLLDAARSLNQWQETKPAQVRRQSPTNRGALSRPGDDFNARGKWADVLTPHGWTFAGEYGDETRWCRPGKDGGVSATTNHGGCDLLHVFSSNADPFEADRWYTKFAAYALLNHGGDFEEAARDLRGQGYGRKTLKAGKR